MMSEAKGMRLKMKVSEFNYNLPEELIAQVPIEKRDESRLMVLNREKKTIEHKVFKDIIDYLEPGDCLVRNNTKVIPARIYGKKETGANVEFLLLNNIEGDIWESIVRPGNKLHIGTKVIFGDGILEAEIIDIMPGGTRKVKFSYQGIFNEILDKIGLMPLPPYIHEELKDNDRYQTVYAKYEGSAAAPTAGLHFTPELLKEIEKKGIKIANVTLHVGIGTFRPVKETEVEKHEMHSEHFYIKKEDVDKINETKKQGKRVIAVGTTSCRVLETIADENGFVKETEGDTQIFIYPGYKYKCIDGLITNFHLPQSTLLMLVSALAGKEFIMKAYNEAVEKKYRFFSFGDAMFIGN
jgi:S-adenosylmethionine:tRNA ribosyltransferase-isomerase